jgi:hypothetical protein
MQGLVHRGCGVTMVRMNWSEAMYKHKYLALVAVIVLVVVFQPWRPPSYTPTTPETHHIQVQETWTITERLVPGCKSRDDADRILQMWLEKDTDAAMTLISPGRCRWFRQGEQLSLSYQYAFFNDNICLRPKGEVDCYWIDRGWVK